MAILLIFIVLMVMSVLFYVRLQAGSTEQKKEETNIMKAISITQTASNMPELRCSFDDVQVDNCIDRLKAEAIKNVISSNILHYYDLFGSSNITIVPIFPGGNNISIYSSEGEWTKKTRTQIPISIFNPLEGGSGKYEYGLLIVEVFS